MNITVSTALDKQGSSEIISHLSTSYKTREIQFPQSRSRGFQVLAVDPLTSSDTKEKQKKTSVAEQIGDQKRVRELNELAVVLNSYADLSENWDREGSIAPKRRAINDALTFLKSIPRDIPIPLPEAGREGDIGIYWDNRKANTFSQVVFEGEGTFTFMAMIKSSSREKRVFGDEDLPVDNPWPKDLVKVIRLS